MTEFQEIIFGVVFFFILGLTVLPVVVLLSFVIAWMIAVLLDK